ncbi:tyrosine-protein phosphatase [Hydrogenimonas urashimensis]|uniref:tyrosine-protein phosphatase n=1 Tax=Hydrogenimonas urashimensis TaxID=2740515 RepID=UPI0019168B4D|nr:CpsB/CapC family capsule biosynthesis tyrosine phosphatase [Hydrogenimonas urashimensis]
MTSFFSKIFNKKTESIESSTQKQPQHQLYVDIHSHLLPGIDDGSKAMFHSIKFVSAMQKLGYKKLIITPHIMSHRYKNSSKIILEKLEILKDAIADHDIDVTLEAASEYYLDDHFLSLLDKGDILTLHGKYVLFEMSYTRPPVDLEGIVFNMILAGYIPVLAHPERYIHMHSDFSQYTALKEQGVLFQLNLNSLAGYYSKKVQNVAKKLVNKGMVDFLGSDIHKMQQIETLETVLKGPLLQKIFEKNKILNNSFL